MDKADSVILNNFLIISIFTYDVLIYIIFRKVDMKTIRGCLSILCISLLITHYMTQNIQLTCFKQKLYNRINDGRIEDWNSYGENIKSYVFQLKLKYK